MSQNALEIVDALVKFDDDWSNGTPQNDDVTLVVLKVKMKQHVFLFSPPVKTLVFFSRI